MRFGLVQNPFLFFLSLGKAYLNTMCSKTSIAIPAQTPPIRATNTPATAEGLRGRALPQKPKPSPKPKHGCCPAQRYLKRSVKPSSL